MTMLPKPQRSVRAISAKAMHLSALKLEDSKLSSEQQIIAGIDSDPDLDTNIYPFIISPGSLEMQGNSDATLGTRCRNTVQLQLSPLDSESFDRVEHGRCSSVRSAFVGAGVRIKVSTGVHSGYST